MYLDIYNIQENDNMASKTIMIQEETYQRLLQLKRENESFNDVILRLIYQKQDLTPFFGLLSEKEGNELEKTIEEARNVNDLEDQRRGKET
ncbi:MAG TPA: antitoxin VapB family protein [Candidatus Lokiarchaeia archaeon]